MEIYPIEKDIPCYLVKASSFPTGVMAAHEQLHDQFPGGTDRRFFGISRQGEKPGEIIYWAAAEKLNSDQPEKYYELGKFIIPKGNYKGKDIRDFMKDIPAIGNCFSQLLTDPAIDPEGFCLEWYYNDTDVRCLVKLK